ncbi:hypothetical protein K7X08_030549 [Anisodus acutangulus]|uniref:DUF1985 domain-containing protein n=1 Tax=Anisodus acutangulus TaxID=402998 RepID=A0A9Q1MQS7_9SOLA|nr:hypothetical protein K7X08_030549 [Anisodus acutangulus]
MVNCTAGKVLDKGNKVDMASNVVSDDKPVEAELHSKRVTRSQSTSPRQKVKKTKAVTGYKKKRDRSVTRDECLSDKSKKKKAATCTEHEPKFYIPANKHLHLRVSVHTNTDVVSMLKDRLNLRQLKMFQATCFGYFLELPPFLIQNQLIHALLPREVVLKEPNELCVKINDTILRFGLEEFAIMTELKCLNDEDNVYGVQETNTLMKEYFPNSKKVRKVELVNCFESKPWKSDEDALKLAVLYFIHSFLFSNENNHLIDESDFELVDSVDYHRYSWGAVVFTCLLRSMRYKVRNTNNMYRIGGLPLAFQTWFYECCFNLESDIVVRVDYKIRRILNWKVGKRLKLNKLSGDDLTSGLDKMNLDESHDPRDDDFCTSPPKTGLLPQYKTIKQDTQLKITKQARPVSEDDLRAEIKESRSDIEKLTDKVTSLNAFVVSLFEKVYKILKPKQAEKCDDDENARHEKEHKVNSPIICPVDYHGDGMWEVSRKHPFETPIDVPVRSDSVKQFKKWVKDWKTNKNKITLNLGVCFLNNKRWFYQFSAVGEGLSNTGLWCIYSSLR